MPLLDLGYSCKIWSEVGSPTWHERRTRSSSQTNPLSVPSQYSADQTHQQPRSRTSSMFFVHRSDFHMLPRSMKKRYLTMSYIGTHSSFDKPSSIHYCLLWSFRSPMAQQKITAFLLHTRFPFAQYRHHKPL